MGLRGPAPSAERIELEKESCSTCGAKPGQSCKTQSGYGIGSKFVHAPRQRALEEQKLALIRRR